MGGGDARSTDSPNPELETLVQVEVERGARTAAEKQARAAELGARASRDQVAPLHPKPRCPDLIFLNQLSYCHQLLTRVACKSSFLLSSARTAAEKQARAAELGARGAPS